MAKFYLVLSRIKKFGEKKIVDSEFVMTCHEHVKRDELVEKSHHLAILQHSMSKMVMKSDISNKAEIETINNLSKLIDTQDQEIAQKELEIRVLKNNGDCRENIEIMENLFTEIGQAHDMFSRIFRKTNLRFFSTKYCAIFVLIF